MTAIEFSDEQSMILETAVNFFREKFPISEIHERNEKLEGSTDLFWAGAKELGWTGIVIPENYGVWELDYASSGVTSYGGYFSDASLYFMHNGTNGQRSSTHVNGAGVNAWGASQHFMMNCTYRVQ